MVRYWVVLVFGVSGKGHSGARGHYRPIADIRPSKDRSFS